MIFIFIYIKYLRNLKYNCNYLKFIKINEKNKKIYINK